MEPTQYPRAFWAPNKPLNSDPDAGELNPGYAHSKKDEDASRVKGRTDVYANAGVMEYPRRVYKEDGSSALARDPKHEKELSKQGHGREAVAPPPETSTAEGGDLFNKKRIEALEAKLNRLMALLEGETPAAVEDKTKA